MVIRNPLALITVLIFTGTSAVGLRQFKEPDPCFSSPCHVHAICEPFSGNSNYNCTCIHPYYGNGTFCSDPCKRNPCSYREDCLGKFENGSVGYDCFCDSAKSFYRDSDGNCLCQRFCGNDMAPHVDLSRPKCLERCSYRSYECDPGYWFVSDDTCLGMNECVPLNPCGLHGHCTLNPGKSFPYSCRCFDGYMFNGATCVDVNECAKSYWACKPGFKCVNTAGSFDCICDEKHSIAVYDHRHQLQCLDVNDCAVQNGGCAQNCKVTETGAQCSCIEGFRLNETDHKSCYWAEGIEFNLCKPNSSINCGVGGVCVLHDDYEWCNCFGGYAFDDNSTTCSPIGNCDLINSNCYYNVKCENSTMQPGYECNCPSGFKNGPLGRCYEYNACLQNPLMCGIYGSCVKVNGKHECVCDDGYELKLSKNGLTQCNAIDYCAKLETRQHCEIQSKACRNTPGSFECYCPIPYYQLGFGDDFSCVPPDDNAHIVDVEMSLLGFYNDTDSYYAHRSLETEFEYQLFGTILPDVTIKNLQLASVKHVGSEVRVHFYVYFDRDVPYLKDLIYQSCGTYKYIKNVNGCALPNNLVINNASLGVKPYDFCGHHDQWLCGLLATCISDGRGYTCQCKPGYNVDGYMDLKKPICIDFDECESEPSVCGNSSNRCINIIGSYFCVCNDCYFSTSRKTQCLHVCSSKPCKNNGQCYESRVAHNCGYGCRCASHYYGPDCGQFDDDVREAKEKTAIVGGVLGAILFATLVIIAVIAYRSLRSSGYFVFRK